MRKYQDFTKFLDRFGCTFRQPHRDFWENANFARLNENGERAPQQAEKSMQARLDTLNAPSQERLILLLDRLNTGETMNPPKKSHYTDMRETLILLGYLPAGKNPDETAILNATSRLSIDIDVPFTTPLDIFRRFYRKLGIDKKRLSEVRQKHDESVRKEKLKKTLTRRAEAPLLNKAEALGPAEIRRILVLLTSAIDAGENFTGLKNGGYKQQEQTQLIQEALIKLGYYNGKADRDYGPQTRLAVKKLQIDLNVTNDGAFGDGTFLALKNFLEERLAEKERGQRKTEKEILPEPSTEQTLKDSVEAKIASPATSPSERQNLQEWVKYTELEETYPAFVNAISSIHGKELAEDVQALKQEKRIDPRNQPDRMEYYSTTHNGNANRLFVNFNGLPFFSLTRNPINSQFGFRLMGKLGDLDHVFIYHISRQEMVEVSPVKSPYPFDFFAENGEKERLFHISGVEAVPNAHEEYEFFQGPANLQLKKFIKRIDTKGNITILEVDRYPEGERAKK